jgi:ribosome-binding protein aMBF1 (putative translation factor)
MAGKKHRTTSDAVEILHRRYVIDRPGREAALEEVRLNAAIAQEIYDLRTKAGLTQKQLAKLVGTTHSVISRLEDADYAGRSLKMLQRISAALHYRLQVRFVPVDARRKVPA